MSKQAVRRVGLQFDDNDLVPQLFGEHDNHLAIIEEELGVEIQSRGNEVIITGPKLSLRAAQSVFDVLWDRLNKGMEVGPEEVNAAIEVARSPMTPATRETALAALKESHLPVKARNKAITARNPKQAEYLDAIRNNHLTFGLGPAGTGKTFLAVAQAVVMMQAGEIDRLILCRPAVEAGERLGFLPGTMQEKIDPYLRPIYDALHDMLPPEQIAKRLADNTIEIAPLAFMRGRTLSNAMVILDEAQNTTAVQMKMALTRIGEGSRMVVTGDLTQTDLPNGVKSGLRDALEVLRGVKDIAFVEFGDVDVVRSRLVKHVVAAYDARDKGEQNVMMRLAVHIDTASKKWSRAFPKMKEKIEQAVALAFLNAKKPAAFSRRHFEVNIILADDKMVKHLNLDYRGKNKPTNVLSFPQINLAKFKRTALDIFPVKVPIPLGDVVMAFQTIQKETREQDKLMENHVLHLAVHGTLHLLGYDHMRIADAKTMEKLECDILASLGYPDPYHETQPKKSRRS